MAGMALTGAAGIAGTAATSGVAASASTGLGLAAAFKGLGVLSDGIAAFSQYMEFQRQNQAEINILRNNTEMVLVAEKQMKRDIDIRSAVMAGEVTASAGARGVAVSGSITNAASLVIARSKIDRLRVSIQAQNQIALNRFKEDELKRQNAQMLSKSAVSTGMSVLKAFAPF